jgi:hypothetical protein
MLVYVLPGLHKNNNSTRMITLSVITIGDVHYTLLRKCGLYFAVGQKVEKFPPEPNIFKCEGNNGNIFCCGVCISI